ncbi:MAG: hypothetical protein L6425_14250, partial [Candidatus Aminicenantes bacterium]|nr:hypothetical protein [Candidatus Aminicenantes bacterium]
MKETSKLRIGLLIDDFIIPSWYYRMIEIIDRGDFGEIVVVVKNEACPPHKGFFARLWSNRNHQLYLLHKWWEQKCINLQMDAFEKKDIRDLLSEIPEVNVSPQQKKYSDYFSPADIERIKKFNVDIFIRMGF